MESHRLVPVIRRAQQFRIEARLFQQWQNLDQLHLVRKHTSRQGKVHQPGNGCSENVSQFSYQTGGDRVKSRRLHRTESQQARNLTSSDFLESHEAHLRPGHSRFRYPMIRLLTVQLLSDVGDLFSGDSENLSPSSRTESCEIWCCLFQRGYPSRTRYLLDI